MGQGGRDELEVARSPACLPSGAERQLPLAEVRLRPSLGLPKWQSPEHLLLLKGEVRSSSTTPLTALRYWAPHWSAKGHARPSDADASRAATVTHRGTTAMPSET